MSNITSDNGIELIKIEPGSFLMGSDFDVVAGIMQQLMIVDLSWEPEISVEWPQHPIEISKSFYVSKYPVTNRVYREIMSENSIIGEDDKPVLLEWQQVENFLQRLNTSDSQFYFRLPTEAEWEYCCKAGTGYEFLTSDNYDDNEKTLINGDDFQNLEEFIESVGSSGRNKWGIYDMLGNVPEWCSDYFDGDYYLNSPATDPENTTTVSEARVIKGAPSYYCVNYYPVPCRSSARHFICIDNELDEEALSSEFEEDGEDESNCNLAGLRLIATRKQG